MTIKLDLKDKKILYLLLSNARIPPKQIAKHVGLSKNAVIYRIKRFQKTGIIRETLPIVNHELLGIEMHQVLLKLRVTGKQEEDIVDYFKKHPNIVWWGRLFGKWNLFIQILSWSGEEFRDTLRKIAIKLGKKLDFYKVSRVFERSKIHHQIFDFEKEISYKFKRPKIDYSKPPKLDKLDKKILEYLNRNNGFTTYAQVGKNFKISMETARNRMKRLFTNGSIIRYMIFLDHKKMEINQYLVNVSLHNVTPEREEEFVKYLSPSKNIIIIFKSGEEIEYYLFLTTESHFELEDILRDMKNKFFNEIHEMGFHIITEEYGLNFFPKGLL